MFQANVPTRPSAVISRASSAPASRRVRCAHSPYVTRSFSPRETVTISFSGKIRSARWKTCDSVSGNDDIKPCIAANLLLSGRAKVCRSAAPRSRAGGT